MVAPIDIDFRISVESRELARLEAEVQSASDVFESWSKRSQTLKEKHADISQQLKDEIGYTEELTEAYKTEARTTKNIVELHDKYQEGLKRNAETIKMLEKELNLLEKEETEIEKQRKRAKEDLQEITKYTEEQRVAVSELAKEKAAADKAAEKALQDSINMERMHYNALKENEAFDKARAEKVIQNEKKIQQEKRKAASENNRILQAELQSYSYQAQRVAQVARTAQIVSAGLLTGAVALAQKYISTTKDQTQLTQRWGIATRSLSESSMRLGEAVAKVMLPAVEKAAELADKFSKFAEKNPELIKGAGIALGSITIIAGIVGTLSTASVVVLQAIKIAERVALATGVKSVAGTVGGGGMLFAPAQAAAGAGAGLTLGAVAPVVASVVGVVLAGAAGVAIYDWIAKKTGGTRVNQMVTVGANWTAKNVFEKAAIAMGVSAEEAARKTDVFTGWIGKLSGALDESSPLWKKAVDAVARANKELDNLDAPASVSSVRGQAYEGQLVKSFQDYQAADLAATQQYNADKLAIMEQARANELDIARNLSSAIVSIGANYVKQTKAISANYIRDSKQFEEDYAMSRAQVVRDGAEEIVRIEKDKQEQLRKLEEDHGVRVEELTRARDALGLAKENRDYARQKSEIGRAAKEETAQRKRETAQRLQDMAREFSIERQRRAENYKQQLKEAAAQKAEQMIEARKQANEALRASRENSANQLRQLQVQYNLERTNRRNAFLAMIRDLDASLLGESARKRAMYAASLKDLEVFLAQYRAGLSRIGGRAPVRDDGGYASKGIYHLAADGKPEFILSAPTTRMAERLVGGQLTQARLIAAISGGGKSLTVNDHRRFDGTIPPSERRAIANETLGMFAEVLNGI